MPTKIMICNCNHIYQDNRYGKFMRVFNRCKKMKENTSLWRCTVCEKTKES